MLSIQCMQHSPGLFFCQILIDLHDPLYPPLKWRRDKNTDMRNVIICQNHISTPAHDNKILFFCHIAEQFTLIKENSIFLRQSVIPVEFFQSLCQRYLLSFCKCLAGSNISCAVLLIMNVRISSLVIDSILLRLQSPEYLIEYFHVIIIDLQRICQLKSDLTSTTSVSTSDTDDHMILLPEPLCQGIQFCTFDIQNIPLCEAGREFFHCFQNVIVFSHNFASNRFFPNRARHVADQGKLASQRMPFISLTQSLDNIIDAPFSVSIKHSSQRRTQTFIYFCIQIINSFCQP